MTVTQAILLGILYWTGASWITTFIWFLQKPLFLGFITGLILGDPVKGAIIGANINLFYIGVVGAGGSIPADTTLAGVLGTALAITGNLSAELAMALAVPMGLLGTLLHYGRMSWNTVFVGVAEKLIDDNKSDQLWIVNFLIPQTILLVLGGGACAIGCYYGAEYIQGIINSLGATFLGVMGTIGGMLPAVGIALTMKYIFKDDARIYLIVGFVLVAVFGLNLVSVGVIGACLAVIYLQYTNKIESNVNIMAISESDNDSFELNEFEEM